MVAETITRPLPARLRWGAVLAGTVAALGAVDEGFIMNVTDAVAGTNERLAAAGAPPISANDVRAAAQDVVREAVRTGRLDKEVLATSLTQQTKMTRADAEAVAAKAEQQFNAGVQRAKLAAQNAAETTGPVFWGVFAALLAGLLASMGGALLAVSREQQDRAETLVGVSLHPRHESAASR